MDACRRLEKVKAVVCDVLLYVKYNTSKPLIKVKYNVLSPS